MIYNTFAVRSSLFRRFHGDIHCVLPPRLDNDDAHVFFEGETYIYIFIIIMIKQYNNNGFKLLHVAVQYQGRCYQLISKKKRKMKNDLPGAVVVVVCIILCYRRVIVLLLLLLLLRWRCLWTRVKRCIVGIGQPADMVVVASTSYYILLWSSCGA